MSEETKSWIMMGLTFVGALLTLALQMLPVTPELKPWLAFGAAAVDVALTIFFGRAALKARSAARAK